MDAAGLDPTVDTEPHRARKEARMNVALGHLLASRVAGLPEGEQLVYRRIEREARAQASAAEPAPLGHVDRGCGGQDRPIGSGELVFASMEGLAVEIGQERGVQQDESSEAITGRATVRYAAFLREELDRLPQAHPLHRRYLRQLRQLQARLGPVAHA